VVNKKIPPLRGLDLCADDTLTQPFSSWAALAYIRAVLSRVALGQKGLQARPILHRIFNLDPAGHRPVKGQYELNLTAREFDLLSVLINLDTSPAAPS